MQDYAVTIKKETRTMGKITTGNNKKPASKAKLDTPRTKAHRDRHLSVGLRWLSMSTVISGGLLLLLLVAPFFRGLFFANEQLVALMYIMALFALWWDHKYHQGENNLYLTPLEYLALALVGMYFLSAFTAINTRAAVQETLKTWLYFSVLWLTLEIARSNFHRRLLLFGIFVAGIAVALFGLGNIAGAFHYPGAVDGGRIASSFQYANTLAVYLTVSSLIGVVLSVPEQRPWLRLLEVSSIAVSLLTFIFTYSRGAWLLFPAAALGLVAAVPRAFRSHVALTLAVTGTAALAGVPFVSRGIGHGGASWVWGGAGISIILSVVGLRAQRWFLRLPRRPRLAVLCLLCTAILLVTPLIIRVTPHGLVERIASISLRDQNVLERLQFAEDALKIVRDHPVLGTGGGGFAAIYQAYQEFGYISSQVHNQFIQTMVETGIAGFLIYLALWGVAIYGTVRSARTSDDETRLLLVGIIVSMLVLGAHSSIDFNLSLSAVSLVLWMLWGLGNSVNREFVRSRLPPSQRRGRKPLGFALANVLGAILVFVFAGLLLAGAKHGEAAAKSFGASDFAGAATKYRRAIIEDPFTASFRLDLGRIELILATIKHDQGLAQAAKRDMQKALALDSANPDLRALYGTAALQLGLLEEGVRSFEQALRLQPFRSQRYEQLADVYVRVALAYDERGEYDSARTVLTKAVQLAAQLAQRHREAPAFARSDQVPPETTPALRLRVGEALALLGRFDQASALLTGVSAVDVTSAEAHLWLGVLAESQGSEVAQKHLALAFVANPALRSQHETLLGIMKTIVAREQ